MPNSQSSIYDIWAKIVDRKRKKVIYFEISESSSKPRNPFKNIDKLIKIDKERKKYSGT